MKNINITIIGLTLITLSELFYTGVINSSFVLWFGYGVFRGVRYWFKSEAEDV